MRRRAAASMLAIPLFIFDAWGAEAGPPSTDEIAVRAVVQGYFDGMMEGSPEKLRGAFHPEAYLIGQGRTGQITRIPFERWCAGMSRAMENPKAYRNEIAAVDISGNAAMVKTVLTWPTVKYVDYLSLLKDGEGNWQIVNKIWDASRP
ncbi:MAG TPA: nuclear transport factor 2 family protein [Longimicrobiales bacterium]|nr:nuclear transport factor 2 family protein [Longimicrobiales bacterium]